MTRHTPPQPSQKKDYRLIGAGVGIIAVWWGIVNHPEKLGKTIITAFDGLFLMYLTLGLFVISIFAFVIVCSNIGIWIRGKKISVKYKDVELNIQDNDKPAEPVD